MYILTTIISKPPNINCSWFFIGWLYFVFCVDYCRWAGLCFCNWSIFPNFFYESWIVKATFLAGKPLQNDITIVDLYRCTLFINLWMFELWIWCFWKLKIIFTRWYGLHVILYCWILLHNIILLYVITYYYIALLTRPSICWLYSLQRCKTLP